MTGGQTVLLTDAMPVATSASRLSTPWPALIWFGAAIRWPFVRNPWFRYSHVGLMGFVLAEALAGALCPLTIWGRHTASGSGPRRAE